MASNQENLEFVDLANNDDYYAWLALSKLASKEEINNAYKRLCRVYHPDKHQSKERKLKAELLFNRIKKAHEVLSDSHLRAIYDTAGVEGLKTEGWKLVSRTKTPQEILEEFERLKKEQEEQILQQRTNPKGSIEVNIDATDIFSHYGSTRDSLLPNIEISEMSISQSVDLPLTTKDLASVSGSLSTRNGNGQGNISGTFRRAYDHSTWAEGELTIGSTPSVAIKAFRTLWTKGYGTLSGSIQFTPDGKLKPGCGLMIVQQLDKHLQGRLNFHAGLHSSITTTLVYDFEGHHFLIGGQVGIPASFLMAQYSLAINSIDAKIKSNIRFGTFGWIFEYGCDKKVSRFSHLGASIMFGVPLGVSLKIRLNRGNQTFIVPIRLSDDLSPSAIFYGSIVPLLAFYIVKKLFIDPYLKEQLQKEINETKSRNSSFFKNQKQYASAAKELMTEMIDRIIEQEEAENGLLINQSFYGKKISDGKECRTNEKVDVTRCLQALVKNSKLIILEGTKLAELPGFYDPCYGESKELTINYIFQQQRHTCSFSDGEKIELPKTEHKIEENN